MRIFESGATRDSCDDKLDFEGFLSHPVLRRYAEYMHKNRVCKDGSQRESDNWQQGIPCDVYMKSLFRHFMDAWGCHRGHLNRDAMKEYDCSPRELLEESLCAILFNTMGYLHEALKEREQVQEELNVYAPEPEDWNGVL